MLLGDYHALVSRQYDGDYAATDILADLATAIDKASLTNRQRQALHYVFIEDLTQESAGERMTIEGGNAISKQTVNRLVNVALVKIARVYEYWVRHDEGYTINNEN